MGVIYSPDAIRDKKYPEPGAQAEVASLVIEWLAGMEKTQPDGAIKDALVGGKAALGSASLTSDVDLLVRTSPNKVGSFPFVSFARRLAELRRKYHVHIDYNRLSDAGILLQDGRVVADPGFVDHLRYAAAVGKLVLGNPLEGLLGIEEYSEQDRARVVARNLWSYADHKINRFFGALGGLGMEEQLKTLQQALALPAALGRKVMMLDSLADGTSHPIQQMAFYDRARYEQALEGTNTMGSLGLVLGTLNDEYTRALEGTIGGERTLDWYTGWLETTAGHAFHKALELSLCAERYALKYILPPES